MLIRFAIENFLSFAAPVAFELTQEGAEAPSLVLLQGDSGTGKTNLLRALGFLRNLVLGGTRAGQPIAVTPCKLATGNQPTQLELTIEQSGVRYRYGCQLTRELVEREWLYSQRNNGSTTDEQLIFERARKSPLVPATSVTLGALTGEDREALNLAAYGVRGEQLLLCEALRRSVKLVEPLGLWLRDRLQLLRAEAKIIGIAARCAREPAYRTFLSNLLASAGLGIAEVTLERRPVDPDYFETEEEKQQVVAALTGYADGFVQTHEGEIVAEQHGRFLDLYQCNLRFVVLAADGRRVELTPAELGDGALRLLHLSPLLYGQSAATDEPPVYFIDELERSLQPALVSALLQTHLRLTRASLPKTQLIAVVRSVHAPELPALSACQKWQLQRPSGSAGAQLTRLLDETASVENRSAGISGLLAD